VNVLPPSKTGYNIRKKEERRNRPLVPCACGMCDEMVNPFDKRIYFNAKHAARAAKRKLKEERAALPKKPRKKPEYKGERPKPTGRKKKVIVQGATKEIASKGDGVWYLRVKEEKRLKDLNKLESTIRLAWKNSDKIDKERIEKLNPHINFYKEP